MNKMQALNAFWNQFGWKAYDAYSTPENVPDKHITYDGASDEFGNALARNVSLWDRSTSWQAVTEKEQQIAEYITRGGRLFRYDGGAFWIKKGVPWAQRMDYPDDDSIRLILLNYELEFLD